MRIIDADALINAIFDYCRSESEIKNHFFYDENIIAIINNAPTVEPTFGLFRSLFCETCQAYATNKAIAKLAEAKIGDFSRSEYCSRCSFKVGNKE